MTLITNTTIDFFQSLVLNIDSTSVPSGHDFPVQLDLLDTRLVFIEFS